MIIIIMIIAMNISPGTSDATLVFAGFAGSGSRLEGRQVVVGHDGGPHKDARLG